MKLYFESSKQLLDSSFAAARKKAMPFKTQKFDDKFRQIRVEESAMLSEAADYAIEKLDRTVKSFPDFSKTNPFFKELAESSTDLDSLKNALGHFSETSHLVKKLKFESLKRLHSVKRAQKWNSMSLERKKFYGRLAGLLKKLEPSVKVVKNSLKDLKSLPAIKPDCFNVVFAGFPNAGKSTMLERLTGSKPEIAHYAFTTKSIMQGFLEKDFVRIQFFDTPGLLDRMPSERNPVERKSVLALKHLADLIVFIIDSSRNSEYSSLEQQSLLEKLLKEFSGKKFFIVFNKCDYLNPEIKASVGSFLAEKKIEFFEEGEGLQGVLKERILEEAKKQAVERIKF